MDLNNKIVLLVGLAKTGVSTIKKLDKLGAKIIVNDIKSKDQLKDIIKQIENLDSVEYILGHHLEDISNIDLTIVSPGVPLDLPFIKKLQSENINIIGEVELAYKLSKNPTFVGITGTNGKTTTTSLVGEIFKKASKDSYIVGNIGNPVIDTVDLTDENSFLITELSSFQLESIEDFKPRVSTIINITEDHLNRHHTMENYINAKANIFKNQDANDFCILNYDDEIVRELGNKTNAKVLYFSQKEKVSQGAYLDDNNNIVIKVNDKEIKLLNKDELSLPGNHNLENCMAAILMSYVLGIDLEIIKDTLKTFKSVEHRLEFVTDKDGIMFVNDSKGTNPDSTIKAITSYDKPIVLIAGGKDKQSDFTEMISYATKNVKALVLLGETADKIEQTAKLQGMNNIFRVSDMKEAVKTAYKLAQSGDVVLLSPACASWDMYPNFEARGLDFKENIYNL
ncbi:UDP-N-acetylmuramoylalanine--D-glutamate ligase (UDP-N-acetylmuramoyl-L-alanyl-D-glutamate synthetase) (D-glutamic acid-adding enzyme) [[Clostridium] sordellii]|uniref:UDP-N-acetylmuramoyl-L-alanine--D-glutamate ligase n=1 Tax=Paraclostridium sordellii TaxID=1505 RepID=UPI000543A600|nr:MULTISPECIES: UDP-N-acetylmuramoyl-L-alanine--D-glutamate ligase [Paeniclostridium]MBW4864313.1 UDP-N-acetylmuramoyl-L-alanine--D-glutamate ligase [Paeniclostridium sp.]MBW4873198.1 UDP-N-acetylmuramoyl-L-alanine--D-glutamate ligase [Paeniclostridium sp.]MBX9180891.1 UDP-N-acetylmuramoyl-L-alanine--D-glutamate ligase [Paeniclostridium sordellii]CEK35592.1 UDP-N-acetylmuramoylalanine--D-glutamate ligase (UDP-N-acetylmuramoyl-L-alanyl-D-glutamate synthetase) (D-glutamic acid-adding enzyme),UDP